MNIDQAVTILAFTYREPLTHDSGGKQIPNYHVSLVREWLDEHFISGPRLERFIKHIQKSFRRSTVNTFPLPVHMEEMYRDFQRVVVPETQRIEPEPGMTLENSAKAYIDHKQAPYRVDEYDPATFDYNTFDYSMPAKAAMVKYGIKICMIAWSREGEREWDNEMEEHIRTKGKPDYIDLPGYGRGVWKKILEEEKLRRLA